MITSTTKAMPCNHHRSSSSSLTTSTSSGKPRDKQLLNVVFTMLAIPILSTILSASSSSLFFFVLPCTIVFAQCHATIIVPTTSGSKRQRTYQSIMERSFGRKLSNDIEYVARLQSFKRPFPAEISDNATGIKSNRTVTNEDNMYLCYDLEDNGDQVITPHDASVAILASQGECSIQHKAHIASQTKPPHLVSFLIVYQNDYKYQHDVNKNEYRLIHEEEDDDYDKTYPKNQVLLEDQRYLRKLLSKPKLRKKQGTKKYEFEKIRSKANQFMTSPSSIPYLEFHDDEINVTIFYVSRTTGLDLQKLINNQPFSTYENGGIRFIIDTYDGWVPDGHYGGVGDVTVWDILSIIILTFICCISMLGLCSSASSDRRRNHHNTGAGRGNRLPRVPRGALVVVEPNTRGEDGRVLLPGRFRHGLRLLDQDEVLSLPAHEFNLGRVLQSDSNNNRRKNTTLLDNDDSVPTTSSDSLATPLLACSHIESDSLLDSQRGTRNEHFQDVTCTICLENYCDGDMLQILPCQHAFHRDCIVPWLTDRSPTCPLCKTLLEVVREGDDASYDSENDILMSSSDSDTNFDDSDQDREDEEDEVDEEDDSDADGDNDEVDVYESHRQQILNWRRRRRNLDEEGRRPRNMVGLRSWIASFLGDGRETESTSETDEVQANVAVALGGDDEVQNDDNGDDGEIPHERSDILAEVGTEMITMRETPTSLNNNSLSSVDQSLTRMPEGDRGVDSQNDEVNESTILGPLPHEISLRGVERNSDDDLNENVNRQNEEVNSNEYESVTIYDC